MFYVEPVLFTLLANIFPTIHLWPLELTSRVIEWLYSFNSFLGMQSHSTYYQPLVSRVMEILHPYEEEEQERVGVVQGGEGMESHCATGGSESQQSDQQSGTKRG